MKKLLALGIMLLIPIKIFALELNSQSLNFKETLEDEQITESFKDYKESDDQVTIYLFRGKGCTHCRAFLTFLNSITDEYGKYFKLVSYEVWYNSDNSELLQKVSKFIGKEATGVPYIIIGKSVFPGYGSNADEEIKKAIKQVYNTKKENRYDVFESMNESESENDKKGESSSNNTIIWCLIFTIITISTIMIDNYIKYKKINARLDLLVKNKNDNLKTR